MKEIIWKNVAIYMAVFWACMSLIYLAFAFIELSLNFIQWKSIGRAAFAFFGPGGSGILTALFRVETELPITTKPEE